MIAALAVGTSLVVAVAVRRAQVRHDCSHSSRMAALRRCVLGAERYRLSDPIEGAGDR